MKLREQFK